MFSKLKILMIIMSLFAVLWSSLASAQGQINAEEFDDRCAREGAVSVVNEMTRGWDNPVWESIVAGISSGDEAWIKASACVGRSADYSNVNVAIDLHVAWAEALPKNPQAVLALAGRGISLGRICSIPLLDRERASIEQYFEVALAALESVPDYAKMWNIPLAIERDVCILRLKDAYANEMKR